jgi:hypothetical protein
MNKKQAVKNGTKALRDAKALAPKDHDGSHAMVATANAWFNLARQISEGAA